MSYPYEWSFAQLKAAALLHLDFQRFLLEKNAILTDATAYNVQFIGSKPVFIDALSLAAYQEGQFWLAHGQFCEQFLNPLLLRAKKGVPHNAWYRGTLTGISTPDLNALLSLGDKFSWNVFSQVVLPTWLERKTLNHPQAAHARINQKKNFSKTAYRGFLTLLRDWIATLVPRDTGKSVWEEYAHTNVYSETDAAIKGRVVETFANQWKPALLIDLGCNVGDYSLAALKGGADYVVGFDFDHKAVELAYERARLSSSRFLPLSFDATNPSPDTGWRQREREGFEQRSKRADALIALAFVHHLAIGKNIPLDQAVEMLVSLAPRGLIEFVQKDDETIRTMLAIRADIFPHYTPEAFTAALEKRAKIVAATVVSHSGRTIYEYDRSGG
ncbi:MAG: 50S ribosomal protein L11 methyltransferase [Magnetococcales bacterium]|nr:50S ribosomal protein L11 methyltransferase [Magnetococcales bacterium]